MTRQDRHNERKTGTLPTTLLTPMRVDVLQESLHVAREGGYDPAPSAQGRTAVGALHAE